MRQGYYKDKYQLVFIVGSGRSGTTLLRNALNEYENIVMLPETNYFSNIYSRRAFNRNGNNLIDIFAEPASRIGKGFRYDSIWDTVDINRLAKVAVFESYESFLDSIIKYFIKINRGSDVVIEKTPGHLFYLKSIRKLYPDSKVIYIERDIRQVVSSYKNFFPGKNIFRHIAHRCYCEKYWNKAKSRLNMDYLEVRYSDLDENFIISMDRISDFLGLETRNFATKPNKKSIDKFKSNLTQKELSLIDRLYNGKNCSIKEMLLFNLYIFRMKTIHIVNKLGIRGLINKKHNPERYPESIKHSC